jgi:hypothetical protein
VKKQKEREELELSKKRQLEKDDSDLLIDNKHLDAYKDSLGGGVKVGDSADK